MRQAEKILNTIAFLLSSLFTAGLFSAFAAWAMSSLDPAVQEAIGSLSQPLIAAHATHSSVGIEPVMVLDEESGSHGPTAAVTADR
jgi:hypothetical protein